jgi:hypothetical protein
MNTILTRIGHEGAAQLALRFPAGAIKGVGAALAAAMGEEGFLVASSGEIAGASWRFENMAQEGEDVLLLGPAFAGISLDEAEGVEEGMPLLLETARALAALSAARKLPRSIVSSGVLVSESGALSAVTVLILPPAAIARALSARGGEARAAAVARLTSPHAKGPEADASFLIAQAAYRYATGKSAFERESAEPGSVAGATRYSMATVLAAPRLDPALAALADRALDDPESVPLSSWIEALEAAAAKGWTREISAAEAELLERRRAAFEAQSRSKRKRAEFLRRRGGILIAAAVAAAVAAFVAGDMLRAQRDKPNFSKLPPIEVARRYYAALDALDLDSLEACGNKKAFDGDWNTVMNLTVVTKTRLAYEGKSPVVHAKDWVSAGMPALAQTDLLYGIAGLGLLDEGGGQGTERLRATYSIWSLDRKDDPSGDPGNASSFPLEERRVDELTLGRGEKGGWKIVGLERKVLP